MNKGLGRGGRARQYFKANPGSYGFGAKYNINSTRFNRLKRRRRTMGAIQRVTDGEKKFFDTIISTAAVLFPTTGVVIQPDDVAGTGSLCLIAQGNTQSNREGRKCVITSISMKGRLNLNQTVQTSAPIQLALVLDTQCNGVQAAYNTIWSVNTNYNSMLNLSNSSRFRILKVFRIDMIPNSVNTAGSTQMPVYRSIKYNKKCNIPINYSGTTGAIAEITSNNLSWYGISGGTTNVVGIEMWTRLRFVG